MSRTRIENCSYKGCPEPATYVLELDGKRYAVCKGHFRMLMRRLEEVAEIKGEAGLADVNPTESEGALQSLRLARA